MDFCFFRGCEISFGSESPLSTSECGGKGEVECKLRS